MASAEPKWVKCTKARILTLCGAWNQREETSAAGKWCALLAPPADIAPAAGDRIFNSLRAPAAPQRAQKALSRVNCLTRTLCIGPLFYVYLPRMRLCDSNSCIVDGFRGIEPFKCFSRGAMFVSLPPKQTRTLNLSDAKKFSSFFE